MSDFVVLLTAVGHRDDATRIARTLVEERLAACVNILLGVDSFYWWEGEVTEEREFLLLCKTTAERLPAAEERLRAIHPYKLPELVTLPIEWGSREYLAWISQETGILPTGRE